MPTQIEDPLIGRALEGRYRIASLLARGGMSSVYVAMDERLERHVAVKVMSDSLSSDPAFVDRFNREARAAARLSHVNVVSVFDQGNDSGHVFLVMELVRGRTLRDLLRDTRPVTPALAASILSPVLAALAAAHRAGLVHRDVKPENILLADDGVVKVADFGLARAIEAGPGTESHTGVMMGTVAYCSPEQISQSRADARSDVYAAGIVMYEMLTGEAPFRGATAMAVAYQHVNSRVPAPSDPAGPGRGLPIPRALDSLVLRATSREPAGRPVDAGAMLAELHDARSDSGLPIVAVPRARTRPPGSAGAPTAMSTRPTAPPRRATLGSPPPAARATIAAPAALGPRPTGRGPDPSRYNPGPGPYGPPPLPRPAQTGPVRAGATGPLGPGRTGPSGASRTAMMPPASTTGRAGATSVMRSTGAIPPPGAESTQRPPTGPPPGARPGTAPARRRPRHWRRNAVILALVLALGAMAAFGSWWWVSGRYISMPDVLNQSVDDARTTLADHGLKTADTPDTAFSETVPANMIIDTTPRPGGRVLPGKTVDLVVSSGAERFTVPDVAAKAQDDATSALQTIPVQIVASQASDDSVPAGQAIRTDPPAGTAVKRDQVITLYMSTGPPVIAVPDVTKQAQSDAQAALQGAGFANSVTQEYSDTAPEGTVIRQTPAGGATAVKFSTVAIVVSRGPELVTIPSIPSGTATATATAALKALGLNVTVHKNFGGFLDQVVGMDPPAGTKVRKGSTVTLETV